jgi:hypothetical protein
MNPICCWKTMAITALVLAVSSVQEAKAQARVRMDSRTGAGYVAPAAGAVGGAAIRLRELTGIGPRSLVRTPIYSASISGGRAAAREWGELTVQFDSDPEWIDELSFQYFALLYSRVNKEYTLLKGAVTYVDVARGRGHLSSAYIRPNTLLRYGDVVAVAVEVLLKGETVTTVSEGKMADKQPLPVEWWKNAKLAPKDGYILNRTQTPFAFINVDDYEAIK